jgi:hypothetical protein
VGLSVFKCSFPCWHVFGLFFYAICLQMQILMPVSVFKCSFSWSYLSSNAVFHAGICLRIAFHAICLQCRFSCLYLSSDAVFPDNKPTNIIPPLTNISTDINFIAAKIQPQFCH